MAGRSMRRPAGAREAEILSVLWAADVPLGAAQVQAALGDLAYNTVYTILTRLVDKGQVARMVHAGRTGYAPATDAAQAAADQMRAALSGGPDRGKILANFVTELSADDEAQLRAALHRGRRRLRRVPTTATADDIEPTAAGNPGAGQRHNDGAVR